jgi:hypothetical protein
MERSPERNGVLKICEELGIGFVPWQQLEWWPRRPCFIFPYSEFRNIPGCRFVPLPEADEIKRAELLNSEYSALPI